MTGKALTVYIDYKSPYAYLAKDLVYELERAHAAKVAWLPYTLDIPSFLGSAKVDEDGRVVEESRSPHQWRRVRYSYMDVRRHAGRRGLTVLGPRKIFDSSIAAIGMLFAQRLDVFRPYNDAVFERFWKRALDIEDAAAIAAVLEESGADTASWPEFLEGEGRREHDRLREEAEAIGVFGVPTFVLEGEVFWGREHLDLIAERLAGDALDSPPR
jgi:2-hydroxychromene-2-carboxylate isomerase